MKGRPRIVIAEDHTILREGLRALFSSVSDCEIVGEATDGREAVRCAENLGPDLILLDLSMPRVDGMQAIREIKKRCPATRILVLTIHNSEEHVFAALDSGADGYVLKEATHGELMSAIKNVLNGKTYLSPAVSGKVVEGFLEGRRATRVRSQWDTLTQREKEILQLIAEGQKNREIANYLCLSTKTVEKHRSNLMRKLDLHSASALTAYAMEKRMIKT